MSMKSDTMGSYAPSMMDGAVGEAISRAKIGDIDEAMTAIAEAEKLIDSQRRRIAYLENLALSDDVTGLINRRGFMGALQRELAASKRDQQAHGILIMVDMDGFKQINDLHGHAAGDAYLAAFAAAMMAEVRPSDIVARLGGDEFAVLLTRTASKPGMARAQTVAKNINAKTMSWRQTVLPFRCSMGMACYAGRDIAEAVMVSADLKLYADKQKRKRALAG
jgi:diguanylate cyclase (GGDEF)-like protein